MKRRFNYFGKYSSNYGKKEDIMTIELDKSYADRLYIALLASKIVLRNSVYLSEEYDFVSDLIYELEKYRRNK